MKRRICSILLALVLCIGLLPASARAAVSAKPWETNPDDWKELTPIGGALFLSANTNYYLSKDIDVTAISQSSNSNVTLDLNGHVLRMTGNDARTKRVIVITKGSFTLQDSDPNATHTDTSLPNGGVITGGDVTGISDSESTSGGAIRVEKGASFTMTGGTIYNCKAFGGGGVAAVGSFTMSGTACIKNCTALHMGGGVDVHGTLTMNSGASITGCTALDTDGIDPGNGGGIMLETNGTLNMNGGSVDGNSATHGRDVFVHGTMYANGGVVGSEVEGACTYVYGRITRSATGTNADTYTTFNGSVSVFEGTTIDEVAKLTVTFDSKGGSTVATQTVLKGQKITAPAALTRAGYSFDGWYTAAGSKWNFGSNTVMSNMTLSAKWMPESYNIIYQLNGGEAGTGAPAKHTYGTATTLVAPTRLGYTFGGWYTNANCTGTPVTSLGATAYTADINLYAKWTADEYKISYVLNGGTNHSDNPTTYTVETDSFTLKAPTRIGYTFDGWTWAGSTHPYLNIIINQGSIGDRSFEANWTPNSYKVKFDKNAADATGTMADQTFTYDVEQKLNKNGFSRPGYTFAGWSYSGETYTDEQVVKNLAASGTVTLSARWTPNGNTPYTVEYYYMDTTGSYPETVEPTSKTGTTDTDIDLETLKNEGAKTGFTFEKAEPAAPTIAGSGNTVVKLYYSRNQHAVTFDSNGGSAVAAQTVYYGDTVTEPKAPTKASHRFDGWYLDGEKYDFATPVTGDITLTASWTFLVDPDKLAKPTENPFVDVSEENYFHDAVLWAVENGVTGGTDATHFSPFASCSRAQAVTFLYRSALALGLDVSAGEDTNILSYNDAFDIPEYAIPAFQWACGMGIMTGNNGNLNPNSGCTRAQIVAFLWRFAKAAGLDVSVGEDTNILSYNDAFDVPEYAIPAFQWACGESVVTGNNGDLNPNSGCTRAQIVTFLWRLLAE